MRYRLGVEDLEPNHWIAWVFDKPGCYSPGRTRAEAIANAGVCIAGYERWLARHEGRSHVDDPYIDIHVAEHFQSIQVSPDYIANAFFEDDRRPLTQDETDRALALIEYTRADLNVLLAQIPPERRAVPIDGEANHNIDGILSHMGQTEWWYMDRLGLAFRHDRLPDEPMERLTKVRAHLRKKLPGLAGVERITAKVGETWSARKLVRRALWHERDHTQHIAKLIG